METRVAVMSIIVEDPDSVEALHQTLDAIPAEILAVYKEPQITEKGEINRE